jgi:hypothetical protein
MACTSSWLRQWISDHGRFVFHHTDAVEQILDEGLIPWDEGPGSQFTDEYTPRPGFVYVGTMAHQVHHHAGTPPADELVAIDLSDIAAERICPDEDAFWSLLTLGRPLNARRWNLADPMITVRDMMFAAQEDEFPLDRRPYESYGQWADAMRLGDDVNVTHEAIAESQTMAIRGRVHPRSLYVVDADAAGQPHVRTPARPSAIPAAVS